MAELASSLASGIVIGVTAGAAYAKEINEAKTEALRDLVEPLLARLREAAAGLLAAARRHGGDQPAVETPAVDVASAGPSPALSAPRQQARGSAGLALLVGGAATAGGLIVAHRAGVFHTLRAEAKERYPKLVPAVDSAAAVGALLEDARLVALDRINTAVALAHQEAKKVAKLYRPVIEHGAASAKHAVELYTAKARVVADELLQKFDKLPLSLFRISELQRRNDELAAQVAALALEVKSLSEAQEKASAARPSLSPHL